MLTHLQPPILWRCCCIIVLLQCLSTHVLVALPSHDDTGREETNTTTHEAVFTVRGTVTDGGTNEALPGVNVLVKGTTSTGTITDASGTFSLLIR